MKKKPQKVRNKPLKAVIGVSALFAALLVLNQCYLTKQGYNMVRYMSRARTIDEVLEDENLPDKSRDMLLLVKEVKEYAVKAIGLKDDDNYTKYVEIERDYLVDVVSACAKDRFEPYEWTFPFFGSFPYKGFYKREDAEREAEILRKKELDVYIRKVDAFSTLGFFSDPVYSSMNDYSVFDIASLVIHEQTHATLFLKNEINFNEELATFIGNEGALNFIKHKYGEDSEYYLNLIDSMEDLDTFLGLMKGLYDELNSLYGENRDREYKINKREEIFSFFIERYTSDYDKLFITDDFKGIENVSMNNAYVLIYMRYTQDLSMFYDLYEKQGFDLKKTMEIIKGVKDYRGDPKEYLKEISG
jgi:predicted aminopeptidase